MKANGPSRIANARKAALINRKSRILLHDESKRHVTKNDVDLTKFN